MDTEDIEEKKTKAQFINVAVFIDYENVHKTLIRKKTNVIRDGFFDKIRIWFKKQDRRVVKIAVYCNFDNKDLHESYHQSLLQSYGLETIHTSNQGKNYADLQLTIDVMNAMYLNNNIDEFVIMSNDKDMTPLLNNIRYNKKKASVITTSSDFNKALCSFADKQIMYEDIIKEPIATCVLQDIKNKIIKDLDNNFNKNYKIYQTEINTTINNISNFNHIGLKYFCDIQSKKNMLMIYEVYNCLYDLKISNNIKIYTYNYRGNNYYAILPSDKVDLLINENIIKESDIVDMT